MSRFWSDAVEVFENAASAREIGARSDVAVVVERNGGLRVVMADGWSAEGLQSHYGASAVYRVTHNPGSVCVEGRGPGMSCTLRGPRGSERLPQALPLYTVEARKLLG